MENLSFDFFENDSIEEAKKLTVVELDFINNYQTNWSELFRGYSKLYAITFSSQLSFIEKVIRTFNYAEIIWCYSVDKDVNLDRSKLNHL